MSEANPANALVKEILDRMRDLQKRAEQATDQLDESQVWYRGSPSENAIGNLVLHLVGTMRQSILGGIASLPYIRDRLSEFGAREGVSKAELIEMMKETLDASCRLIESLPQERITEELHIQGIDITVAAVLVGAVSHLGLHVGQIQFISKSLLKEHYQAFKNERRTARPNA